MNEHAAVEGRDWFCEGKRLNQHFDAERRPTAGKGECDISISKALHGVNRSRGQHLLLRDQSAVDIGDDQANIPHKDLTRCCATRAAASPLVAWRVTRYDRTRPTFLFKSGSALLDVLVFEMDGIFPAAAFRIHIPACNPSKGNQAIDIA